MRVISLPRLPETERLPALTRAEREVLALLGSGLSSRVIAERRGTSVHTVSNQLAAVYRKLGVSGRLEALRASRPA